MMTHTEEIALRPFLPEDREQILDILTDATVSQTYMLPEFTAREDAIPLFQRLSGLSREVSRYVRCIALGKVAIGFLNDVEVIDGRIELGYVIHPDYQGRGYMTAALTLAMEELLKDGYQAVVCGAFAHNAASMRVMEKCGMTKLAYTDSVEYRGQTHHCIYYAAEKEGIKC